MGKAYVKKQIKKLKVLADKEEDLQSKEMLMVFHDVFKFLVDRTKGGEPEDEGTEE